MVSFRCIFFCASCYHGYLVLLFYPKVETALVLMFFNFVLYFFLWGSILGISYGEVWFIMASEYGISSIESNSNVQAPVISVDVGSGYVKAASHLVRENSRVSFPSLVAEAPADLDQQFQGENKAQIIQYRGKRWITGADAIRLHPTGVFDTLTMDWAGCDGWLVLLFRALYELGVTSGEVHLVTGVPQAVYRSHAAKIGRILAGEHHAVIYGKEFHINVLHDDAMVLPQAAGGLYYWLSTHEDMQELVQAKTLIAGIDVGTYTTGYAVLRGVDPVPALSGGVKIGMSTVASRLSSKISQKFDIPQDREEAMQYLERRRKVFLKGKMHDLSDLIAESVLEIVSPFLQQLSDQWNTTSEKMFISVYGGGANDFYPAIVRKFPHAVLVDAKESGGSRFLPALGMMVYFASMNNLKDRVY